MTRVKIYIIAGVLIAAIGFAWWRAHVNALLAEGARQEKVRAIAERDSVARLKDSILAVRVTATTDTFVRLRDRWRDRLVTDTMHRTDTLVHRDTVVQIINAADSVIRACDAALSLCNLRVQSLMGLVANRDSLLVLERGLRPKPPPRLGVFATAGPCVAFVDKPRAGGCITVGVGFRVW